MEGVSSEERCTQTLVGELVQVLEMVKQLDAHMVGGGEERCQCQALVATMQASIDRSVHIARSCCSVFGQPESPPSGGGGGSPLSAGSDQAGDSRGRGNAAGQCKKRKTLPKWSTQVRVSTVQDVAPLDDGLSWRKYGQKDILGAKYPRSYFRCTHRHTKGCHASKQVQRVDGDPLLFDVVYHGNHTCAQAQAAAAHLSNQVAPLATSAENSPPQPGLEMQATASPMFERSVLPFRVPSNKQTNDNDCETSGGLNKGCVAVSTLMPTAAAQAAPESQLVSSSSSSYTAGVQAELASMTNSPMGDMDFMFSLDDATDFLENTANYF